jgi:hypothetical protein
VSTTTGDLEKPDDFSAGGGIYGHVDEDAVRDVVNTCIRKKEFQIPADVTAERITTEETEPYRKRQPRGPRDPVSTPPPKRRQRDRDRPARRDP